MQKRTERFDLAIRSNDEKNIKKSLQLICDQTQTYPISIRKNDNGFVVSFLRHPDVPSYSFQNTIMDIANNLKYCLTIPSIIIQKRQGTFDDDILKSEIIKISDTKEIQSTNKDDTELMKKYLEDEDYFNSFLGKQILEGDYDTSEGRKADKRTLRLMRTSRKLNNLISETTEGSKKVIKGQYTFNLEKMM